VCVCVRHGFNARSGGQNDSTETISQSLRPPCQSSLNQCFILTEHKFRHQRPDNKQCQLTQTQTSTVITKEFETEMGGGKMSINEQITRGDVCEIIDIAPEKCTDRRDAD
jgi:hypothetical protein